MAFVTVPSIKVGDEIKVENFNDFITSVNAISTSGLNQENIRDEGIDRRNLALKSIQDVNNSAVYFYSSEDDHEVTGSNTTWDLVRSTTTADPISVGRPSGIVCKANERLMVNCSFSFRAESGSVPGLAGHAKGGQEVHFKLRWTDFVSGSVNDIGGTERRFNTFLVMSTYSGSQFHTNLRYSCTIVGVIIPSTDSEIKVDLLARDRRSNDPTSVGVSFVEQVTMFARVIKR